MKKIAAIIPARGGSKGLPGKNIINLGGKHLIVWTIDAALESKNVSRVIVSTDDMEIQQAALKAGAEAPFLRPTELSGDSAKSEDVVLHALEYMEKFYNESYDILVLLQPTSPFRTGYHIDEALRILENSDAESVISGVKVSESPYWMKVKDEKGYIRSFMEGKDISRRQELPEMFYPNGGIYAISTEVFKSKKAFVTEKTLIYEMSFRDSIDIDTNDDLTIAKAFVKEKNES